MGDPFEFLQFRLFLDKKPQGYPLQIAQISFNVFAFLDNQNDNLVIWKGVLGREVLSELMRCSFLVFSRLV
eukprot:UN07329